MILDRPTFERLHAASLGTGDVVVHAADVRTLLDAAAEIDRHCELMTRELAETKGRLIEEAARSIT